MHCHPVVFSASCLWLRACRWEVRTLPLAGLDFYRASLFGEACYLSVGGGCAQLYIANHTTWMFLGVNAVRRSNFVGIGGFIENFVKAICWDDASNYAVKWPTLDRCLLRCAALCRVVVAGACVRLLRFALLEGRDWV